MIGDSLTQGSEHAIAIFVVKRLAAINSKYGRAVGDEVMLRAANHYAQHLSAATYLYRWNGPALVALMPVHKNAEEIKRSWGKAAAVRLEVNLEAKQRAVFVVVEMAMWAQIAGPEASSEELFRRMDGFVADQAETTVEGS